MSKKILPVLLSVVLMVGLCPAAAFAAVSDGLSFAVGDALSTQAQGGFVADRVYAVIGNDYAMMVTETDESQTIDIIDSDYNSTLQMSYDKVMSPYGYTQTVPVSQYQYDHLMAHGMCVSDKDTELKGLVSFEGERMIIPCQYDSLYEDSTGTYAVGARVDSDGTGRITVLSDVDGSVLATANVGQANYSLSASWSGLQIVVYRNWSSGVSGSGSSYSRDEYSFNGSALALVSTSQGLTSDEWNVTPSIIQRYVETETETGYSYGYEYYDLSGNRVESLVGWQYRMSLSALSLNVGGQLVTQGWLFANDEGQAKAVDEYGNTLRTYSWNGSGSMPKSYDWGTVGYYVRCEPSAGTHCYLSQQDGSEVLRLDESERLSTIPSGYGYYSRETVQNRTSEGSYSESKVFPRRYFDADLNELTGVSPALGSRLLVLPDRSKAYESGLDAEGCISSFSTSDPNVLTADGSIIALGDNKLALPATESISWPVSRSEARFGGTKDAYCVKSPTGKYGLSSWSGDVVIPAVYEDYFSGAAGCSLYGQSDYAMVKSADGSWRFVSVNASEAEIPNNVSYDSISRPSFYSGGAASSDNNSAGATTPVDSSTSGSDSTSGNTPTTPTPVANRVVPNSNYGNATTTKLSNTLWATATAKTLKASKLKKKARVVKMISVGSAKGSVSYANASTTKKLKKFKINARNGKITVPKGTNRGTYKVKVTVTAAGDATYASGSKTITCKIKVK